VPVLILAGNRDIRLKTKNEIYKKMLFLQKTGKTFFRGIFTKFFYIYYFWNAVFITIQSCIVIYAIPT